MINLKNAELFTLRQRQRIILPLYRNIIKLCYGLKTIDPLASKVIKAIVVLSFRERSNEGKIVEIKNCIKQAYKFRDDLISANNYEDVIN